MLKQMWKDLGEEAGDMQLFRTNKLYRRICILAWWRRRGLLTPEELLSRQLQESYREYERAVRKQPVTQ